jgi:fructosamine-3-kinase
VNLLVDDGEHQALVMEWIITGNRTKGFWKRLGIQLAQLHTVSNPYFGLDTDNYMGSVPQRNSLTPDWIGFFIQNRISPLIEQCIERKLLSKQHEQQFEKLFIQLHSIMSPEKPSLLHGDLWSGNFMCDNKESPVFIDPAAYFGHRSMDLAMTTLFGGFDPVFYQAYNYHFPFPDNYKEQWAVCNLYPLLIHLLLFGKTYLSSIETTLKEFQ